MNTPEIEILISSDCNYEEVVAEIQVDGKFVALLSQDLGVENLEIEFPGKENVEKNCLRKLNLSAFLQSVDLAKRRLLEED